MMAWLTVFVFLVALTLNDIQQLVATLHTAALQHCSTDTLTLQVREYLSGPVDVATTLQHKDSVDFPSVTVCNLNMVSCCCCCLLLLLLLYLSAKQTCKS